MSQSVFPEFHQILRRRGLRTAASRTRRYFDSSAGTIAGLPPHRDVRESVDSLEGTVTALAMLRKPIGIVLTEEGMQGQEQGKRKLLDLPIFKSY